MTPPSSSVRGESSLSFLSLLAEIEVEPEATAAAEVDPAAALRALLTVEDAWNSPLATPRLTLDFAPADSSFFSAGVRLRKEERGEEREGKRTGVSISRESK